MKKHLARYSIPLTVTIFALVIVLVPQHSAQAFLGLDFQDVVLWLPGFVAAKIIMPIMALLVYASGMVLNYSVHYSVVDMASQVSKAGINQTWTVIRDLANMGFIFVLLYTALQTMFGYGNYKETIKNMVIAALLINFSLFFTKAIIDASNVLALLFYKAITPGSTDPAVGISSSFMNVLGLGGFYDLFAGTSLNGTQMLVMGLGSAVLELIASFTFLAVAVMFLIRLVVLIFVLALSPIYFIGMIVPNVKGYAGQWLSTLTGQAFFAPVYFMLTWVALKVAQGLFNPAAGGALGGSNNITGAILGKAAANGAVTANPTAMATIINYFIVIGLLVGAFIAAKGLASKAPGMVNQLTGKAIGKTSNLVYGKMIGGAGRGLIGTRAVKMSEDTNLIERTKQSGMRGAMARLQLYGAKKAASASFDARRASLPNQSLAEGAGILVGGALDRDSVRNFGKTFTKINTLGGRLADTDTIGNALTKFDVNKYEAAMHRNVEDALGESNIDLAKLGVGTSGVGTGPGKGAKEIADEDRKRDREFIKTRESERKKADDKAKIEEGSKEAENKKRGTTFDQAKIDAMVGILRKMSEDQIKEQKAEVLALQDVAEALSQKQIEAIQKSGNYTPPELKDIDDARGKRVKDALTAGAATHIPATATTPARTGYEEAVRVIKKMEAPTIAKMPLYDAARPDRPSLTDPNTLEMYTPGLLGKLIRQNEFTQEKADAVRDAIIAAGPTAAPGSNLEKAYNWMIGPRGQELYSS